MNTNNFHANYARTSDLPSQMESPALSEAVDDAPTLIEHREPAALPRRAPRRTLPLTSSDEVAVPGTGPVATSQALVTTDQRSGLPLAPTAPPGQFERWLGMLHPGTFWLSVTPVIVGAVTAWLETLGSQSTFYPFRLVFLIVAVLALHGGANLLNESYDVQRGTDGPQALGSSKIIQRGLLPVFGVRRASFVLFGLGTLVLLVLTITTHTWGVLVLGGASLLLAFFYSATRYALGYFPLSELIIGFVMGPAVLFSSVQLQGAPLSSLSITFALALGRSEEHTS